MTINQKALIGEPAKVFVTGTDTGVGKTTVTQALCRALQQLSVRVGGRKPVASGACYQQRQLRNEDALALMDAVGMPVTPENYQRVNPFCYAPAIAPHIAAARQQQSLSSKVIAAQIRASIDTEELLMIEGAGGWLVPLSMDETMADVAMALNTDVVLVVGMQLGCMNHALLTVADIQRRGLTLVGWVGNQLTSEPMACSAENYDSLARMIPAPCWAKIPFSPEPETLTRLLLPLAQRLATGNNPAAARPPASHP